ncbi:MAG TPA: cation:proton antiporter [Luteibaculaceae bacterium]|nr:cation:proton antiporter [Luteibaculaceae bacterium]
MHLSQLIVDLALILAVAGATYLLFTKIKQPVVLGYILAGFLVGPEFSLLPSIAESASIQTWGEIGVIVLLFTLGLEFSFKRLLKLGGSALITGVFEIGGMMVTGFILGRLLGFNSVNSIFLGGIICISSTTIILKAFEELDLKKRKFAQLVTGVLVVEDLAAVLLIVVLSTLALGSRFDGQLLLANSFKLVVFLSIWFFGGIFLLPSFFRWSKRFINDEGLLVLSLALCLTMVVLAYKSGFSPALGAFVMGSLLAETDLSERIEHILKPLKDLFGAIFFVSVGMLLSPNEIAQNAGWIVGLSAVVIAGKAFFVTLGSLAGGQALKQSVQTGFSMTQIGEFSFIIAALGNSLQVTSPTLYPVAVGVSVLTAFTTPIAMKQSLPFYQWLQRILPAKVLGVVDRYSAGAESIKNVSHWREAFRAYVKLVVIHVLLILGVVVMGQTYLRPLLNQLDMAAWQRDVLASLLQLIVMAPFLWALAIRKIDSTSYRILWLNENYNKGPLLLMAVMRLVLAILLVGFMLDQQFSAPVAFSVAVAAVGIGLLVFSRRLNRFYHRLEERFLTNYHEKEKKMAHRSGKTLLPWDAHLASVEVKPHHELVGKTLEELALREHLGINIALIERGEQLLYAPQKDVRLFPGDKLAVIGTDLQLESFTQWLEQTAAPPVQAAQEGEVVLEKILVDAGFPFINQSIRHSQIRELTCGLVVGLEREGQRILNPESGTILALGDLIWLVGQRQKIQQVLLQPVKRKEG